MRITLNTHNIYFVSDYHFFHQNILKYDKRPFKDLDEMHDEIIKRWNQVVKKDDIVFYLGDLSFGHFENMNELLHKLNGKIYYTMGNHDKYMDIKSSNRFEEIQDYYDLYVLDIDCIDKSKKSQHICISHYPYLIWNRKHYQSFHLHGHEHQALTTNPEYDWYNKQLVMDVGCNGIDYTPISYKQIKEIMRSKFVK